MLSTVQVVHVCSTHVHHTTPPTEKPPLAYGQDLWRDFLRDFVLEVVQRPVIIAGNSIGGFISASLAADYPQLVRGLVLVNSAGPIVPGYTYTPPAPRTPPPQVVVDAVSYGLFVFLERTIKRQLGRLYPTAPGRADAWLAEEIFRAACDPGALGVFRYVVVVCTCWWGVYGTLYAHTPPFYRSVFYLPPPRALNYLLDRFNKPALVFQGALDPLNDAPTRARSLQGACSVNRIEVELVDAGHCPFDEQPEMFNASMIRFAECVAEGERGAAELEGAALAQG